MVTPSTVIDPPSKASSPTRQRRSVVFPAPLRPSTAATSPRAISIESPRSASAPLPGWLLFMSTIRIDIGGSFHAARRRC